MKNLTSAVVLLALAFCFSTAAYSQTASPEATPASTKSAISEGKAKLITELFTILKMDGEFARDVETMLQQMEEGFSKGVEASLDEHTELTPSQKEQLRKETLEEYFAFSRAFRERFPKEFDLNKFSRELIYPLWDKYYTEQELRDIIAFYRSPTGIKLLKVGPAIGEESSKIAQEVLIPKALALSKQILEERQKAAPRNVTDNDGDIPMLPPPPKPLPKPVRDDRR